MNKEPNKPLRVLYLLPPSETRLSGIGNLLQDPDNPARYLFYGLDYFARSGVSVRHNLMRPLPWHDRFGGFFRQILSRMGAYSGDLEWLLPVWGELRHAEVIVAFSDRMVLPLLYLRLFGFLPRTPVLYLTMGLPEKIASFRNRLWKRLILSELRRVDWIVPLSSVESRLILEEGIDGNVQFVRVGVDTNYYRPIELEETIDVCCIGADPYRDFFTLFATAKLLPDKSFLVVASNDHAKTFGEVPANVRVLVDIPMAEIRHLLATSRTVAIPVRQNSYSGGTTVMLQAMSMGRTVVANAIGANAEGYGFIDNENCIFFPVGDCNKLAEILGSLLGDDERRRAIGRKARSFIVENLSLETFHASLLKMVDDIASRNRGNK